MYPQATQVRYMYVGKALDIHRSNPDTIPEEKNQAEVVIYIISHPTDTDADADAVRCSLTYLPRTYIHGRE